MERFAKIRRYSNGLAAEFGLISSFLVQKFVDEELPKFFVAILERFEESMIVMRHEFNWDLVDVVFYKALSSDSGMKSWGGLVIKPTQKNISKTARADLVKNTAFDKLLYDAAVKQLDRRVAEWTEKGVDFKAEIEALRKITKVVQVLAHFYLFLI